jgi:ABC-type arginine/histidine transport system permease subunit
VHVNLSNNVINIIKLNTTVASISSILVLNETYDLINDSFYNISNYSVFSCDYLNTTCTITPLLGQNLSYYFN